MKKKGLLGAAPVCVVVGALLGFVTPVSATIVQVDFTGIFTTADVGSGVTPHFSVGNTISGHIIYDTNTPINFGSSTATSGFHVANNAATELFISSNGFDLTSTANYGFTGNVATNVNIEFGGFSNVSIDPDEPLFSASHTVDFFGPSNILNFDPVIHIIPETGWDSIEYVISFFTTGVDENYTADLSITTVTTFVPLPATVWLFGSGLLGLFGVARRKKA